MFGQIRGGQSMSEFRHAVADFIQAGNRLLQAKPL